MNKFMSALLCTFLCLNSFIMPVLAEEDEVVDDSEVTEEVTEDGNEGVISEEMSPEISGDSKEIAESVLKTVTVKFDKNADDATGEMEDQVFVVGDTQELIPNAYQREGYEFVCWTATPDRNGELYYDGQSVSFNDLQYSSDITFYAQWEKEKISVQMSLPGTQLHYSVKDDGTIGITGYDENPDCDSTYTVDIPSSIDGVTVTSIEEWAFANCVWLSGVVIPDSVISIENNAFYNCTSLISITIPEGVTIINRRTFWNCNKLKNIIIPDSVTVIDDNAFDFCTSLTGLIIPDKVTYIGREAFFSNFGLTDITIPDSVTCIGVSAFFNCSNLVNITLPNTNITICNDAFAGTGISSIKLPDSMNNIPISLFRGCTNLRNITIPEGVTSIGEDAFLDCVSLISLDIPEGVEVIGDEIFRNCASLVNITIPKNVTKIPNNAFMQCTNLNDISIPKSVRLIGRDAFCECLNFKYIKYEGTEEEWNEIEIHDDYLKERLEKGETVVVFGDVEIERHLIYHSNTVTVFDESLDSYAQRLNTLEYSPVLSYMLGCLADSAYGLVNSNEDENSEIYKSLNEMGFNTNLYYDHYDDQMPGDHIAFSIGVKNGKDNRKTLAIVLRGSYADPNNDVPFLASDWRSDFDLFDDPSQIGHYPFFHAGFYGAFNEVKDVLESEYRGYLEDSNCKILITGHSRGAAVANLLEHHITINYNAKDRVFGYNFACPNVAIVFEKAMPSVDLNPNILNINNEIDLVPMIPVTLHQIVRPIYFTPLMQFIKKTASMDLVWTKYGREGKLSTITTNPIEAHSMITSYLPVLAYQSKVYLSREEKYSKEAALASIKNECPTDLEITDKNTGEVVVSFTDNHPYLNDKYSENVIAYAEDDKKYVYYDPELGFDVSIVATDNGTMKYAVTKPHDDGTYSEKHFDNVQLEKGKRFISEDSASSEGEINLQVVDDKNRVIAEIQEDGTEKRIHAARSALFFPSISFSNSVSKSLSPMMERMTSWRSRSSCTTSFSRSALAAFSW